MSERYDIVIRDGYLADRDAVRDIAIIGGEIATISAAIDGSGAREVDAGGDLVAPGFADAHKHVDRALSAIGARRPLANEEPNASPGYVSDLFDAYYADLSIDELADRVERNLQMAVAAGTTHVRSHVAVDGTVGTDTMEAVLRAAERMADAVDLQVVPYAARGYDEPAARQTVEEAIRMARERLANQVLLGGSLGLHGGDPATSVDATLDQWFDIASAQNVELDVHITSRGAAGYYTLDRLAAATNANEFAGRVTAVHAWALAQLPDWWLGGLLDRLSAAGIGITYCYNSLRKGMPLQAIDRAVTLAHGTDNDQDFVYPHGNADPLEAMQVASYELIGEWHFDTDYRWSETNPALRLLWKTITDGAAETMGIDGYGIHEGTPANLVVFDAPSPEWAIIQRATRRVVCKAGRIVATDGTFVG